MNKKENQEKIKKKDFIEIDYIGKVKDTGEIFDTNIEEKAKEKGVGGNKIRIICIGEGMILKAIDEFLIGKEMGKYIIELPPEKAFGMRRQEMIKVMPISVFNKHNVRPQQGMFFSFDGMLGKILSNNGGRVRVDFNNPLAGKEVVYEINVKRKIEDENEKVKALIKALFSRELNFEIEDRKVVIDEALKNFPIINILKEKLKQILNLNLEFKKLEKREKNKTEKN